MTMMRTAIISADCQLIASTMNLKMSEVRHNSQRVIGNRVTR